MSASESRVLRVEVTDRPIGASALALQVSCPRAGAIATFEGVVRDHHQGKRVAHLEYEAYAPMAEKVLREVAEEAVGRWVITVAPTTWPTYPHLPATRDFRVPEWGPR